MIIEWGTEKEDVDYVTGILDEIQEIGSRARTADNYAEGHAAFVADLRGQATLLGIAIPGDRDIVEGLTKSLRASRDHEGAKSEEIIQTGRGEDKATRAAIHLRASAYSGRRGYLDSAFDAIVRGAESLAELRAWEEQQAARRAQKAG